MNSSENGPDDVVGGTVRPSLASALFEAAVDCILVIDEWGVIQAANQAALRSFGFTEAEVLGHNVSLLMPEAYARPHDAYLENYRRGGERKVIGIGREVMGRRKDGTSFPLYLSVGEFQLEGRRLFVGICHDISERRRSAERVAFLAAHDSLTGCANRHQLLQALSQAIQGCLLGGGRLAILFIDLDGFKQVNDSHGHRVGDRLLVQVAELLRGSLRDSDMLGRMGGDEFVAVVPLDAGPELAEALARRLIDNLRAPFVIDGVSLSISASIGISLFPGHGQSAAELTNEADIAMYQAKLEGGGCVRFFDQALREKSEQAYRLLARLRQAIVLGQFELHYQPQFDLHSLRPSGLEALLRWRDGANGLVQPGQFIPIAREHGLMPEIGRWVIQQACRDNAELIAAGLLDAAVAVNICAPLFGEAGFVEVVHRGLRDSGLSPARLEVEISDDIAISNSAQVLRNAQALAEAGVGLAMDDFGAGFSSLSRLKTLRFSKLKIDRSFVAGLPDSPRDRAIVEAIFGMACGLGMRVVAKGIETEAQLAHLRTIGCTQGQGFWFARPMPLHELRDWLASHR